MIAHQQVLGEIIDGLKMGRRSQVHSGFVFPLDIAVLPGLLEQGLNTPIQANWGH